MARSTEGDMSSGDEVVTEATPCMEEEGMSGGPPGLYNGHLVLTVSTESAWWDPRFEYDHCREMLAQHGFQVPPEDLELPLRRALDSPDVRRFLFFNSALFLTLLAPALYLVIWCCLYSSFHVLGTPFSQTYFAAFCLVLSAAAVMVTGAIILVLNHYHGKISVNMEVRLTQANELLRKHNLLVGLSDRMKNCTSQLFLIFCYFGVSECLKRLTDMLDREHKSTQDLQRKMKRKFGSICVVVIQDSGRPRLCGSRNECVHSEETPLLEAEREAEPGRPLTGTTSSWACCMAPVGPPQIQGKWHLISSAYQKEEQRNLDKQDTFGWMEIHSTDGMKFLKYGQGQQGQIVIYNHENLTFLEEDDSVKIKDNAYKISSQVHTVSDDCIVVKMNNDTDVQYSLGEFLFCRSQSGNDAEREAFKTYSNCNNLDFMVERRSNFNYATECDSVTYMKDPLDPNTITGRWQLLARASVNPIVMFVGRNPWVEFSWAEEKLKILDGHGNFHFSQEEVEVKGRNIVIGKANSTYMAFYQDCEECLLMRTENHQKVVVLQLLTRSGNYTDSQMEKFQTNSRCLSLPVLYEHEVSEPHEEEGTECKSMRHILDVFVPNKISGKWHMVAKAHSQPGKMEEEDDPWLEYSYDGHNLTIHEGRSKHSWPVKEIEVRGHKIVIQKETPFYVTFHPTCEDCLLMKTDNGMEVVLNMFTRSGKLADSEIKTFKDKAHCLNLSNVLVYKRATLHEEEAP